MLEKMSNGNHPAISSQNYPAIVLAAYGSSHPRAMATYARIVDRYQKAFFGSDVKLAFTSKHIRERLAEKECIRIPGPLTALADLQDQGCRDVAVQPLHIVPGSEFHELASLVQGFRCIGGRFGFRSLEMGRPLLADLEDCRRVSFALTPILDGINHEGAATELKRDTDEEAVVLVGHGSSHPGDCIYSQMADILERSHKNAFLGTLEGHPGLEDVVLQLKRSGVKKARLIPFLLVAGGHAVKDMAGDGKGSWRSILESRGFDTSVYLNGLGESEGITDILIAHTGRAVERMDEHSSN